MPHLVIPNAGKDRYNAEEALRLYAEQIADPEPKFVSARKRPFARSIDPNRLHWFVVSDLCRHCDVCHSRRGGRYHFAESDRPTLCPECGMPAAYHD